MRIIVTDFRKEVEPEGEQVFIQAPRSKQFLVEKFMADKLSYEKLREELGDYVAGLVLRAKQKGIKFVELVEPDLEEVMHFVNENLKIKGEARERILRETEEWLKSMRGFYASFIKFLYNLFFFLPVRLRLRAVEFFADLFSWLVNIIPGDQYDVVAAINMALEEEARKIAEYIDGRDGSVIVRRDIAFKLLNFLGH